MSQNAKKKPSVFFKIVRWFVWLFYPKIKIIGTENLPDEPCIIVGNHTQMNGPIIGEIHFPGKRLIWCVGDMLHLRDVPAYAFQDFWSQKPKHTHWFYKIVSYIIAPLSVFLMNNARTIGVYHDSRILSTFKATVAGLQAGANIIIFPEHNVKYNHIVYEFTTGFIEVARLYYKKTGREVSFVPMYNAPKLKKTCLGKPIKFCASADLEDEKKRISDYLMNEITAIAESLPEHTVIPYRNIPKKNYPSNKGEVKMRKPVVDYREFRFSKLNDPQFSHLKYLLGWVGYFTLYILTELFIPVERCYVVHSRLDDIIPFCEVFIVPYVGWYLLVIVSLLYFALYNPKSFVKFQSFIIITQIIAMAAYIFFPTMQDLRPTEFARDNIFTDIVRLLYTVDTNTNVCPSLHVGYSIAIASAWLKEKEASIGAKAFVTVFAVLVCMSTAIIKQHSVIDAFAAVPMCLFAEIVVYKDYWLEKFKIRKATENAVS